MPENCALSGVLQTGHLLDGFDGKGQGAATSGAAHDAGVVVLEEATGHIAGNVQAGNGLVVAILRLAVFSDGNTLHTAQQRGTQPAAVEGRGADGAQAACRLAEVLLSSQGTGKWFRFRSTDPTLSHCL